MADIAISTDDHVAISNLMGLYQHLIDEGDEEGWSALFTEDGTFNGLPEALGLGDTLSGREALKQIARSSAAYGGAYRHHVGSFCVAYGGSSDEAIARYYAMTSINAPGQPPQLHIFAVVRTELVRTDAGWKIRSNTMRAL